MSYSYTETNDCSKRLSKTMGAALVGNNFSPIPSKISFQMKKKVTRRGPISTKHPNPLTVELSQYRKSGTLVACFPQASRSRAARPVFVLARPTRPSCAGARPQELGR